MYTLGKVTFGALAVAAVLAFGGLAATPAAAETANKAAGAEKASVSDTDFSSHWRYRRRFVRPFPYVYPYSYGYYRPRPYYYRPYYYGAPYAPVYYRPYYRPYHWGGPTVSIGFGFGPRHYW